MWPSSRPCVSRVVTAVAFTEAEYVETWGTHEPFALPLPAMAKPPPPPQLYAIRATAASIAVVFAHRGPWFMIARWNLDANKVEPGTWFRGRIYQRRCDISPDGKWLY